VKDVFAKKFLVPGEDSAVGALASVLRKHSTEGRTPDAAARRHSAIEGSSFSGLLTRVEIDHMRIGSAGKAASSHAGPASLHQSGQ
jgi:hypothetical protein